MTVDLCHLNTTQTVNLPQATDCFWDRVLHRSYSEKSIMPERSENLMGGNQKAAKSWGVPSVGSSSRLLSASDDLAISELCQL
jgi:hypothetical protein